MANLEQLRAEVDRLSPRALESEYHQRKYQKAFRAWKAAKEAERKSMGGITVYPCQVKEAGGAHFGNDLWKCGVCGQEKYPEAFVCPNGNPNPSAAKWLDWSRGPQCH